jgi:hypothetical protein
MGRCATDSFVGIKPLTGWKAWLANGVGMWFVEIFVNQTVMEVTMDEIDHHIGDKKKRKRKVLMLMDDGKTPA